MLGSDLRPEASGARPVAQIIDLAEIRRGRAERAHQAAQGFRVGDKVICAADLDHGCADVGILARLPGVPHGRAIVQFHGLRRALYLSELQRVAAAPEAAPTVTLPCDVEARP